MEDGDVSLLTWCGQSHGSAQTPLVPYQVAGVRAAVQLREQDFGNFQDPQKIDQDMNERIKFGRFWFR